MEHGSVEAGLEEVKFDDIRSVMDLLAHQARPNALLVAPGAPLDAVLAEIGPCLREPVVTCAAAARGWLPDPSAIRTVVFGDVTRLSLADQRELVRWLATASGRTQVVVVSAVPIFPLVQEGAFLDALYYRLNTLYFVVGDPKRE